MIYGCWGSPFSFVRKWRLFSPGCSRHTPPAIKNWRSAVGTVTWLKGGRLRNRGSIYSKGKNFFQNALTDTVAHPVFSLVARRQSFWVKEAGDKTHQSPTPNTESKNEWNSIYLPPYAFQAHTIINLPFPEKRNITFLKKNLLSMYQEARSQIPPAIILV